MSKRDSNEYGCREKKMLARRTVLKCGALAGAAAAMPGLFARAATAGAAQDRILVLVQLDGGNDGLNMVVPHGDDLYYKARPSLGLGKKAVERLDDYVGLHPNLKALRPVWDSGNLAVVQGVGYPNPNRSHFYSSDIWHTASTEPQGRWSGWVGRALDRTTDGDVPGLHLDPGPLSLALVGEQVVVPSIGDADRFRVRGDAKTLAALARRPRRAPAAEAIRASAHQAYRTAQRVEAALRGRTRGDSYPGSALARRLWQVARLIEAGMPSRVYAVRLSGFDTHARQAEAHGQLMLELGAALGAFQKDLAGSGFADRVLTMTYSEFGRRVKENRSLGTDHGAAAPLFVMGGAVQGGLKGAHPSLSDLDEGDLKHHTDFRQVYATILERWLKTDAAAVLGARHKPVAFL